MPRVHPPSRAPRRPGGSLAPQEAWWEPGRFLRNGPAGLNHVGPRCGFPCSHLPGAVTPSTHTRAPCAQPGGRQRLSSPHCHHPPPELEGSPWRSAGCWGPPRHACCWCLRCASPAPTTHAAPTRPAPCTLHPAFTAQPSPTLHCSLQPLCTHQAPRDTPCSLCTLFPSPLHLLHPAKPLARDPAAPPCCPGARGLGAGGRVTRSIVQETQPRGGPSRGPGVPHAPGCEKQAGGLLPALPSPVTAAALSEEAALLLFTRRRLKIPLPVLIQRRRGLFWAGSRKRNPEPLSPRPPPTPLSCPPR